MKLDSQMSFRERTGGFDLRGLEQATATRLKGLVQERDSDQFGRFTLVVEPEERHRITRFGINAIPRPTEFPVARLSEAEVISALRAKVEKEAAAERFTGAVLVAKSGKVVFDGAYSFVDREKKVANKLDTRFRIGSMNNMFTAVSILPLVQGGKIKLTEPLGKYITDYPNQDVATKVTIHHLPDAYRRHGLQQLWNAAVGVVVERVSGKSYYDYAAERIYKPAGMTLSGSEPESEAVHDRSIGYTGPQGGGAWTANTNTLPCRGTSAGGGYSTLGDLMKFADALMRHTLLNAEYTELLISGKVDTGGGRKYAYGFEDGLNTGMGAVGHGGERQV